MRVYIVLVNITIINKDNPDPAGSHNKELGKVVTTKQWLPWAQSVLGPQVLHEFRGEKEINPRWEQLGIVSRRGWIVNERKG